MSPRTVLTVQAVLALVALAQGAHADLAPAPLEVSPDPNIDYYLHVIPADDYFGTGVKGYEAIVKGSSGYATVVVPADAKIEKAGALDLEKALEVWKKRGHFYGYIGSMAIMSPTPVTVKGALAVDSLDPDGALKPEEPKVVGKVKVPDDALEGLGLEGLEVEILRVPTDTGYAYVRYDHGPLTALITGDETVILPATVDGILLYDLKTGEWARVDPFADQTVTVKIAGGEVKIVQIYVPMGAAEVNSFKIEAEGLRDRVLIVAPVDGGQCVCVGKAEKTVGGHCVTIIVGNYHWNWGRSDTGGTGGGSGGSTTFLPLPPLVPPIRRRG